MEGADLWRWGIKSKTETGESSRSGFGFAYGGELLDLCIIGNGEAEVRMGCDISDDECSLGASFKGNVTGDSVSPACENSALSIEVAVFSSSGAYY